VAGLGYKLKNKPVQCTDNTSCWPQSTQKCRATSFSHH